MCVLSTFLDHFIYISPLNTELLCHLWVWWTQRRENTVSCQNWLHYQLISSRRDGTGWMWESCGMAGTHRNPAEKENSPRHPAACYRSSSIGLMCVTLQTRLCLNKRISVLSFPCTTLYAYIPAHNQTTNYCFLPPQRYLTRDYKCVSITESY